MSEGVSAITELNSILNRFDSDLKNLAGQKPTHSINHLLNFISNRASWISILQSLENANQLNDQAELAQYMKTLCKFFQLIEPYNEFVPAIKPFADELLTNSILKIFYRCLNIQRDNITGPVLLFLSHFVSFNNGSLTESFLERFDLSLSILPDLMNPSTIELKSKNRRENGVRTYMIKFWTNLCSSSTALTRLDLLTNNRKIMTQFFKHITTDELPKNIEIIVKFFDESVLDEVTFSKGNKSKIINELALQRLADCLIFTNIEEKIIQFLTKAATDTTSGLVFSNNISFLIPKEKSMNGTIQIGSQFFRTQNRHIYYLISHLTPWSSSSQLNLVEKILSVIPELLPLYTAFLHNRNGAHEPKLTSFFIGQTLLYNKILQLDVPTCFINQVNEYIKDHDQFTTTVEMVQQLASSEILTDVLCPSALNKGVLGKGLMSNSGLIKHLTAQLIINSVDKYSKIMSVLNTNNNTIFASLRQEIKEIFLQRLPDVAAIVGVVNDTLKADDVNKVLLVTLMKLVSSLQSNLQITVPIHLNNFGKLIGVDLGEGTISKNLDDIDLLLLDSYLGLISTADDINNKWWNVSKGVNHSLFTIICKLPWELRDGKNIDLSLVTKVVTVLKSLVDDKLLFQNDLLESQIWAIVLSLYRSFANSDDKSIEAIGKIIDESISRCIKTPYKYIDSVSSLGCGKLSPWYITLCEQSKFANDDCISNVKQWLAGVTVYLYLLGEPLESMKKVLKNYWPEIEFNLEVSNLEDYITRPYWDVDEENNCTFDYVSFASLPQLKNKLSKGLITKSDMDAIGVLNRAISIINDEGKNTVLEKTSGLIMDFLMSWGGYIYQKSDNNTKLLNKKYWSRLFINDTDSDNVKNKKNFALGILNEIFESLECQDWSELRNLVNELLKSGNDTKLMLRLCDFLWVFEKSDILNKLESFSACWNEQVILKLIKLASKKNVSIPDDQFLILVKNIVDKPSVEIINALAELSTHCNFQNDTVTKIISLSQCASDPSVYYQILGKYCQKNDFIKRQLSDSLESQIETVVQSPSGFDLIHSLAISNESFKSLLSIRANEYISRQLQSTIEPSILSYLQAMIPSSETNKLINLLTQNEEFKNSAIYIFSSEFTPLVAATSNLKIWLNRALLYITKVLAETDDLTDQFLNFVSSLKLVLTAENLKSFYSLVDSQLETIMKRWLLHPIIVNHAINIMSTKVNIPKQLGLFVSNEPFVTVDEEIRFLQAKLLLEMIKKHNSTSTEILIQTAKWYRGLTTESDKILKATMMLIEEKVGHSWAEWITTWEFGEGSLIADTPGIEGLRIMLDKNLIRKTIENENDGYDCEFLLLLIANNDELFKFQEEKCVVNMRAFIDSGLFQLCFKSLGTNNTLKQISTRLLAVSLLSVENELTLLDKLRNGSSLSEDDKLSGFKERNIFKVLLGNILSTMQSDTIEPIVLNFWSYMVPILANPAHFLYEKAYRYLLSSSKMRGMELPMYKSICQQVRDEHISVEAANYDYSKELEWWLTTLLNSFGQNEDIKVLRRMGIIEWALNLLQSPFASEKVKDLINNILEKLISMENGADWLIRNYGLLSFCEGRKLEKLGLQAIVGAEWNGSDKRAREWTGDDLPQIVKRLRKN